MWIHHIICFLSPPPSCRKAGRSQKQAVPKGSMRLAQICTPAQEAFNLGLKALKKFCISFSFTRTSDALFAMFTLPLANQEMGCLWFGCSIPWAPALLLGRASSSCCQTRTAACGQPTEEDLRPPRGLHLVSETRIKI